MRVRVYLRVRKRKIKSDSNRQTNKLHLISSFPRVEKTGEIKTKSGTRISALLASKCSVAPFIQHLAASFSQPSSLTTHILSMDLPP